uniref:Uncharacterized protein n=1 Tax=Anguilla anguilla TaxID=7936 RepID=A0A0E9WZY8_ANGAN
MIPHWVKVSWSLAYSPSRSRTPGPPVFFEILLFLFFFCPCFPECSAEPLSQQVEGGHGQCSASEEQHKSTRAELSHNGVHPDPRGMVYPQNPGQIKNIKGSQAKDPFAPAGVLMMLQAELD